jgi:hypothetical protein
MALHRPKGNVMVATRRRAWPALAFRRPPSAAKAVARFRCSLGLAAGLSLLGALGPVAAHAAAPVPFTLTDTVDQTDVRHFTTTGGVLCASGTFTDDVDVGAFAQSEQARSGGGNVLIHSHYTCDDGSGTFESLKHIH